MTEMPSRHLPAATPRGLRMTPSAVASEAALGDPSDAGARWNWRYRARLQVSDTVIVVAVVLAALAAGLPWIAAAGSTPLDAAVVPAVIAATWLLRPGRDRVLGLDEEIDEGLLKLLHRFSGLRVQHSSGCTGSVR